MRDLHYRSTENMLQLSWGQTLSEKYRTEMIYLATPGCEKSRIVYRHFKGPHRVSHGFSWCVA